MLTTDTTIDQAITEDITDMIAQSIILMMIVESTTTDIIHTVTTGGTILDITIEDIIGTVT